MPVLGIVGIIIGGIIAIRIVAGIIVVISGH